MFDRTGPSRLECSSKGCRADAVYQLYWNNPQLHAPEFRKTWLACEEHREWLADFLRARGFLHSVGKLPSAAHGESGSDAEPEIDGGAEEATTP